MQIKKRQPGHCLGVKEREGRMFILLNWWCDETIMQAQIITDEEGHNMVFSSFQAAKDYAEKELNGHYLIAEG